MVELAVTIVKRKRADPDLSALALARRLKCSHTTVIEVLRKAGLYEEPKPRRA